MRTTIPETSPRKPLTYTVHDGFFKRPTGWTFVQCSDVDVDENDHVYVFSRGQHSVMIFDKQGTFLGTWGEPGDNPLSFQLTHGLTVGRDGHVYTTDGDKNSVCKWTKDGKLLMTIGQPRSENLSARSMTFPQVAHPFRRPTSMTVASSGDYYVADGHGNSYIHCFDPSGKHKFSWGGIGRAPGQFDVPHGLCVDWEDGDKVYCADRNNNRVQFFSPKGEFLGEWTGLHMPNSVRKRGELFYVAEFVHRVSVLYPDGTIAARWGDNVPVEDIPVGFGLPDAPARNPMLRGKVVSEPGPGLFFAPHGMTADSEGSIYVADAAESWAGVDRGDRSVQKFICA